MLLPSVGMEDIYRALKYEFKGSPMDIISRIIELVGVLKQQYRLPIADESKR